MEFENLINTLNIIGEKVQSTYKDKLKNGSYASGRLFNSVEYKIKIENSSIKLLLQLEDYWIHIENGRLAGKKMPPLSVIKKWMLHKGIESKNNTAYLIARAISKRGIKPKPYLAESRKIVENYNIDLQDAIIKDINITIKNKLK